MFASAYLGARPIADALAQGADIVITGRVADASLFLAPLAYEHGWAWDDWDRLAAGIVVGHLLECSGQSLGGNYSGDWWALPHPWDLPYPIADVDGRRHAPRSASRRARAAASRPTPCATNCSTKCTTRRATSRPTSSPTSRPRGSTDLPDDRVAITGVRGTPATDTYKLLLAHHAGWSGEARVAFSWPDAYEKAKATAAIFVKRVEMAGLDVAEWRFEYWGVDALGGPTVPGAATARRCPSHPSACCASRGAATTSAPPDSSGASWSR